MKIFFENYIKSISSKFSHKETSEMGYRTDFENLLKEIFESINVQPIGHDDKAKQETNRTLSLRKMGCQFSILRQKTSVSP